MSNYTRGTNFTAKDSLVTGNPSKLVKGSEIDAELNAISTATATKLDTTTAASTYAPLASPALTGNPTAPTQATSDDSTKIATTEFVQNVAMNASLPGQSVATIGKFPKSNGTDAVWDYAGIATVNSSITSNATVSGSYVYQPVAMTALGKSVTLPDATTLSTGGPQYIFKNEGGYPFGIRDSAGTLVMAVAAGGIAYVTLKDNSTAAGSWSVIGDNLEPGLITIDSTFSSTYASTVLAPFVALDNNTSIHFAALSSGFAAFVVDNTGKVVGTPVTVDATASAVPKTCFKVSATSAIVFYTDGTNSKAVVLSVSGTSVSVGTPASFGASLIYLSAEDFSGAPKVAQLSSTLYLVSYIAGAATQVNAISVSGTTVTIGSLAQIIAASSVASSTTTYALTATTALVVYKSGSNPYPISAVVVSVSGTTCTVGTPATAPNGSTSSAAPASCIASTTKAWVACPATGNSYPNPYCITISGTTASFSSLLAIESLDMSASLDYTSNSATRYNPHLFPLSSTTALFWYLDSNSISRAVVLSESGGTVTAGTKLYGSISTAAVNATGAGVILPQGTSEFISLVCDGSNTATKPIARAHKISGTTVSTGASKYVDGLSSTQVVSGSSAISYYAGRLTSGDYVLTASDNLGTLPVLRSNGDAIAYRGEIKIPLLSIGITPMWPHLSGVASNRFVLLASTKGSTVSSSGQLLRLLNIEICQ